MNSCFCGLICRTMDATKGILSGCSMILWILRAACRGLEIDNLQLDDKVKICGCQVAVEVVVCNRFRNTNDIVFDLSDW